MNSLMDEIDKFYEKFKDEISYTEFRELCFEIHACHTKQYLRLLFGEQNKKHDIVRIYSRHIAFHVRRSIKQSTSEIWTE